MRCAPRCPVRAMRGWMDIGTGMGDVTSGSLGYGGDLPMPVRIGPILTTTVTIAATPSTKVTGIMKTTATTTTGDIASPFRAKARPHWLGLLLASPHLIL